MPEENGMGMKKERCIDSKMGPSEEFGLEHLPGPRLGTTVEFERCFVEVLEKSRAEPPLHLKLGRVIPIASGLLASPFKLDGVTGESCGREKQPKALVSIWNRSDQFVDHRIDA